MSNAKILNKNNEAELAVGRATLPANAPIVDADGHREASHWRALAGVENNTLRPISGFGAAAKRLEDFVLGSIALVILFPLMLQERVDRIFRA